MMDAMTAREFALPKLSTRYGAPMGRPDFGPIDPDDTDRVYAFKVPLVSGGYDKGGAYWGTRQWGRSLYAVTDGESYVRYVDATSRAHAIELARAYP